MLPSRQKTSIASLVWWCLFAGSPIQWDSHKQTLISLSTAEAELNALVEGLAVGRSVRSLSNQLQPIVDFDLFNDNRAAIILAGGQGGGWQNTPLEDQGELPGGGHQGERAGFGLSSRNEALG